MTNILVVADDADTRSTFLKHLRTLGCQSIGAENSQIGLRKAQEQLPDLIIYSTQLAKLDALDFINFLYKNDFTAIIPLIFLVEDLSELFQCFELPADGYIKKSCTPEELHRVIKVQLIKQAARKHGYTNQLQQVSISPTTDKDKPNVQPIFPSIPRLNKVFEFIASNYDKPISLSDVAKELGYSAKHLTTVVAQTTGKPIQKWIIECRITAAQTLLMQTNESVYQIALKVGYENPAHFHRQFRDYHGTSPQAWRETKRNGE
ncbi:MAG: helix-turn-helix domain-containing protein [Scytonematopsis contorta HA4267-MV1]|jgi:AraC-like DNA-binding protein|nr:helix-turn-helix domain-containing protein [Scytonematopsis contorta HA4267-MV1]